MSLMLKLNSLLAEFFSELSAYPLERVGSYIGIRIQALQVGVKQLIALYTTKPDIYLLYNLYTKRIG